MGLIYDLLQDHPDGLTFEEIHNLVPHFTKDELDIHFLKEIRYGDIDVFAGKIKRFSKPEELDIPLELPIKINLVGGRVLTVYAVDQYFEDDRKRGKFYSGEKFQTIYLADCRPWTSNPSYISEDIVLSLMERDGA